MIDAEALARALPAARPAVVLELGGGSGSAALAVLERLARDGPRRLERWTLTDVVPTFLRRAERAIRGTHPSWPFEFRRLDIEGDFEAQGIAPGSVDVVYAVNTVHIAQDLPHTLRQILRSLRPGGRIVISGTTSGPDVEDAGLTRIFFTQLSVIGSTMGTRRELDLLVKLLDATGARPLVDRAIPMEQARDGFAAMAGGDVFGKVVFTR